MIELSDNILSELQSDTLLELDISYCHKLPTLEKIVAILKTKENQSLHTFKINYCKINSLVATYLEHIFSRLKGLHELELKYCNLLSSNLNFLTFCQGLRSISLAGTHLSITEFNQFTSIIKNCKHLIAIDISEIRLKKRFLPALGKALSTLPVKYLNMKNNYLGSDCGSQVAELLNMLPLLSHLNLQCTCLGMSETRRLGVDKIGDFCAVLASHLNLQYLNLANNWLGESSIERLMKSLKLNKKIKFLNLSNNKSNYLLAKASSQYIFFTSIRHMLKQQYSLQHLDLGVFQPHFFMTSTIKAIQEKLNANKKAEITRRNEFVLLILNLANFAREPQESANLFSLPLELLLAIFSFMDFSCIGKETEVGLNCIRFLFNNGEAIMLGLSQSKYKHQPIIIEKVIPSPYLTQFGLFKSMPLVTTEATDAMDKNRLQQIEKGNFETVRLITGKENILNLEKNQVQFYQANQFRIMLEEEMAKPIHELEQILNNPSPSIPEISKKIGLYNSLGCYFYAIGDYKKALEIYEKLWKMNNNLENYYRLVLVKFDLNNFSEALNDIKSLGSILVKFSKYKEAIDIYTKGLELFPCHIELSLQRGNIFYMQDNIDEALNDYGNAFAFSLEPNDITINNNYGQALLKKGAQEVINGRPQNAISHYKLAMLCFDKAYSLDPTNETDLGNCFKCLKLLNHPSVKNFSGNKTDFKKIYDALREHQYEMKDNSNASFCLSNFR